MSWLTDLLTNPIERRALAATLRPVRVPARAPLPAMHRLWYTGRDAYFDVFIDLRDGHVCWCQVTLRGLSLTFDPTTGRSSNAVTVTVG